MVARCSVFFSAFGFVESILTISANNHIVAREICAFPRFYYIRVVGCRRLAVARLRACVLARGSSTRASTLAARRALAQHARRGPDRARSLSPLQRYTGALLSR